MCLFWPCSVPEAILSYLNELIHSILIVIVGGRFCYDPTSQILEMEMATHSSALALRIPWTEEPGGPQSTGSQESDTTEVT